MLRRKKSKSISISIPPEAGNFAKEPPPEVSPSSNLYRSLEIPLDRFIRVYCEDDFLALIIDNKEPAPDIEELMEAWSDIFLDYVDANGDNETRHKVNLQTQHAIYSARYDRAKGFISILQIMYVQAALDELRTVPAFEDAELDPADQSAYFERLNIYNNRTAEIKIDRDLAAIELAEMIANEQKGEVKKAEKSHFLNILSRIATYKKVAVIHTRELTTAEFCAMFAEYLDYINALKASNKRR
jgi:hypothetical protein